MEKPQRLNKISSQEMKIPANIPELIARYDLDNLDIYEYLDNLVGSWKEDTLNYIYPVGSIYISVNPTNPSDYLGGTWEAWGSGRVPVGIDTTDTDFNEAEKTGGSKVTENLYLNGLNYGGLSGGSSSGEYRGRVWVSPSDLINSYTQADNYPQNIVQPYITCYMWKRTN